ncbi:MAG: hypothetical protein ABR507_11090 [Actinomycetota bacterium]
MRPSSWNVRLADQRFDVYGWSFVADRGVLNDGEWTGGRAPEFLSVLYSPSRGLRVTGSGDETVTTSAIFRPLQRVLVSIDGNPRVSASADLDGRLTVVVPLGQAHSYQQYTPQGRVAELDPNYWTTAKVTFLPEPSAMGS